MPPKKYALTATDILEKWASQFPSVQVWLSKINGAKPNRALRLFYFCDWAQKSPDELLNLKKTPASLKAEKLLDLFIQKSPYPLSTKWNCANSVKSFFRCNYRQLQREAGKIEYVATKPHRRPEKDKRKELYQACFNQRDRALIYVNCTSAIALETLANLTWAHFEDDWQKRDIPHISIPAQFLKGHGHGRFKNVRQETFITPGAKTELVKYREFMRKQYGLNWTSDMHVFLSLEEPHAPLTYGGLGRTVKNISAKAGVPFSVHDGRRIVETALENVGMPRNWIQKVKGRKVRGEDNPYSQPAIEQLRAKYQEALPELEFLYATEGTQTKELEELRTKLGESERKIKDLESTVLDVVRAEMKKMIAAEQAEFMWQHEQAKKPK